MTYLMTALPLLMALAVTAVGAIDSYRRANGTSLVTGMALLTIFLGERVMGDTDQRMALTGVGLVILMLGVLLRGFALQQSEGSRRTAHVLGLAFNGVSVLGLLCYVLTLEQVTTPMGLEDEAFIRWTVALQTLATVLIPIGFIPMAFVDRVIGLHTRALPARAPRQAVLSGLSGALALCLVFPVNYLATHFQVEKDTAYFRTTKVGESTANLVRTLGEPVEITAFYPPVNDVRKELEPYFRDLQTKGEGKLKVTFVDQPLAPDLAEELKIRENGYLVFKQGEGVEKIKIGTNIDRAKRELKKLDGTVQKNLLKIAKGPRVAYFLTGHGEANFREKGNPLRKLNKMRKLLELQNYKVKNLGVTEGSAQAIPDDADVLIIAAPTEPLLDEEVATIKAYMDNGGATFIMAEPGGDPMTDLLGHVGVTAGNFPIAHQRAFIRQSGTKADRTITATNRFGSHASVKTVSRNGTQMALWVPTVAPLEKGEFKGKLHTIVRSYPESWEESIRNFEKDPSERSKVFDLAYAVDGEAIKAIVIGDVTFASDPVLPPSVGNQQFILDTFRWLTGDDDIAGDIANEEDVEIQHSNDDTKIWFWATVFGMPLVILGFGILVVRFRGRKQ